MTTSAPSIPAATHPPTTSALTVQSVSHSYGQRKALNDVTFTVAQGERFGLLGPNGSGKSTLFKLISTLVPIQHGQIAVHGSDAAAQRDAVRKSIGVVFQQPALDKQLTVMENIACHAALFGIDRPTITRRAADLLNRFNLSDRANDRVNDLSGGMRRKVELAKALLPEPRLLLLDEPSTGLDVSARIELWNLLEDLRKNANITVVLTTHLMDEADRCDRLAILDQGQLLDCQRPDAFKSQIGGDIITLTSTHLDALAQILQDKLQLSPQRVGDALHIERPQAHLFIPHLIESAPGLIDSVSVGRPTLDDVFVRLTGRRLTA